MKTRLVTLLFFGAAGAVTQGCGSNETSAPTQRPIDSVQATTSVNQRVDDLIGGLAESAARLDTSGGTAVATEGVNTALGSSSCPGWTSGTAGPSSGSSDDPSASVSGGLDDLLHRLAQEAKDHVFREEFVEVKDGKQVVYKIDPATVCDADPECVDKLTRTPVRFAVTSNSDDTMAVALLIGEARINPATAVLGTSKISMRGDLAKGLEAIRPYVKTESLADLPEKLTGVLDLGLEKRAAGDFAVTGSLVEKFDLLVGQAKGKPVAVVVQPSAPTAQLTVNAATNTLGYSLAVGAVDVRIAGAAVCGTDCGAAEKNGTFIGHAGGMTAAFAVSKGATELSFNGLGLGKDTAYVSLNNERLGTLDVNANQGRAFSMTFKKTAEGTLVSFEPALDVKLALMLNKLSESLRVDMPSWLSDEIFDIMLGGDAKPSVLIPAPTCDAYGSAVSKDELKVTAGSLHLNASSAVSPVDVTAGMCLLPIDGVDSGANPVSRVRAGACK